MGGEGGGDAHYVSVNGPKLALRQPKSSLKK